MVGHPSAAPVLFASGELRARDLTSSDVPALQALFDANPEYFLTINGRRPHPNEAQVEFEELPPAFLTYTHRWVPGLYDRSDQLVGVASVLSDLMAQGIWHIGLLLIATRLHGRGQASAIYSALESWAFAGGAEWMRLGVVTGNDRAERLWDRLGFVEVRRRAGVDTGGRINDVKVMVKPLRGGRIADYLARIERDRPDSTLP